MQQVLYLCNTQGYYIKCYEPVLNNTFILYVMSQVYITPVMSRYYIACYITQMGFIFQVVLCKGLLYNRRCYVASYDSSQFMTECYMTHLHAIYKGILY